MSVRDDLRALVQVQQHELELVRIGGEIAAIASRRVALQAQIADAEAVVKQAEQDVDAAQVEAKRLDLDLKSAEENVGKFKDQMLSVKTNEQLWAIQEQIRHAEDGVGEVETKILEQLEIADSLGRVIHEKKAELVEETKRVDGEVAAANEAEAALVAEREQAEASMAQLRDLVPADLMGRFENIKELRAGIGVAEVYEEVCLVCNTTVRPQLYVEAVNVEEIIQCENCKRIIYVADRLGLPGAGEARAAAEAAAAVAEAATVTESTTAAEVAVDSADAGPDATSAAVVPAPAEASTAPAETQAGAAADPVS